MRLNINELLKKKREFKYLALPYDEAILETLIYIKIRPKIIFLTVKLLYQWDSWRSLIFIDFICCVSVYL